MKKYLILFAAAITTSFATAQSVTVPQSATETFNTYYNGEHAENIVWSKTDLGYTVTYSFNYKKRITKFNDEGSFIENWIFTELERLDDDVAEYLTANYPDAKVIQGYELTSNTAPQRAIVDILVNGEGYRLRFRPNGEFYIKEKIEVSETIKKEDPVFSVVEVSPSFPGGSEALFSFIDEHVKPVATKGRVYVTFIVNKDGTLTDVKIVKGIDSIANEEALRIVKLMPKWTPGKQRGEAVRCKYTLPILIK